ncbi:MucB/RseB C-terminal domain-containing protein [Endozoicomonas sp. Mp262]|uniref:MucB/RseB C-terminal domain-containing protein n=1 Tax=Endozoicomonas sp. Mp262 TaxID=2919499 RepID=UPI0021D9B566
MALLVIIPVSIYAKQANPQQYGYQQPPQFWLEKMSAAFREQSYRGVFVYQEGNRLETLAVTQQAANGKTRERILYLDGLPREMVRSGDQLTYTSLDKGVTRFNHGSLMPMVPKFSDSPVGSYYKVSYSPRQIDRIAGREAVVLSVIPVDHYRYGYQLWLDAQFGLLLKSVMIDSHGKIMERLQFTHIEPGVELSSPELAAMDKSNVTYDQSIDIHKVPDKEGIWNWESGWLPEGFSVKSYSQRPSPVSEHKTDTVIYSDGLASFSVFVEPDETKVLSQASENIGALAAVSKVFRNGETYFHVTVVGEVPLGTAERVAVSVRPKRAGSKPGVSEE